MNKMEIKVLTNEQLYQTSEYINDKYNLDTWVNDKANCIWLSVWNKELTDTYDIEMSKEQTKDFYNEFLFKQEETEQSLVSYKLKLN